MIQPEQIPQFTGDLAQLETDYADLKKDAGHVRKTGEEVHSQFQGLSAYYTAPEAEQLFATTKPVKDRADTFGDDLETVSGALSTYATEIRPLVDKLKELKTKAHTFVDSVKDDDEWEYDGDKVDEHNQIRDDITATVAAFWAAERTCHNKITALWGGTQMVAGDGSDRKDQYGFAADDLKNAKLPWGDPVEEKHHWYEVGHWVKSFVWDGLIVDGVWGTIKGLGTLVGFGGWDAMGQAWKGLAQLATGLTLSMMPGAQLAFWALPDDKLPSWIRDSRTAMKETGKALVAWDEWGKNPGRAAGAVTFNVLTTVFTGGAGAGVAGAGKAGAVAKVLSVAGKAGKVIDPMTYIAKGAGAGLSKIGDITKGLRGVGNIDISTLPDGAVNLPDGRLMDPNGNLISPNGAIDTTPVHYEPNTPTVPHGTTPTLPAHWTTQGAPTPSYAGSHAGTDAAAHTVDNAGHYNAPNAGHYNTPTTPVGHTPGGAFDTTPSPSAYDHAPSGSPYGQAPSGSPYGHAPSGSPYDHAPSPSAYDQAPGTNPYAQTPSGSPYGHAPSPSAYDHAPSPSAYDQTPTTTPHDAPTSTPHTGGHDVPGTGGHGTPDAPHGTGHDIPGAGHADDASHGAGHGDDGVGHHADDAAHAGDHAGVGDAAAHHGTDAPGHQGADVPGSGAGEPFEYQPHVSDAEWDKLTPAQQHQVAYAEISDGTVPFATDADAIKYGQTYWNDYAENMPEVRRQSVWDYTDEPNYGLPAPHPDGWGTYKEMNGYLRGDDSKLTPYVQHNIDEVDAALAGHAVPEDVLVVRGTGIGHLDLDDPLDMLGNTYRDKGYMSTSLGNHPVAAFAGEDALLHLRVPKGTPALWVEKVGKYGMGERELLLGRGTEYRVTRVFRENGQIQVYGEVLPR
ncbi:ADP-ribosyltransferase [Streptomyces sp. NPDC058678]|uniref:ADP-ribosyltransferase n=1 Tax=Streptomyces sp. NPDC058678 TaxID=3346595 RepID=UPI00365B3078